MVGGGIESPVYEKVLEKGVLGSGKSIKTVSLLLILMNFLITIFTRVINENCNFVSKSNLPKWPKSSPEDGTHPIGKNVTPDGENRIHRQKERPAEASLFIPIFFDWSTVSRVDPTFTINLVNR